MATIEHRNEVVRRVLMEASEPLGPSEIGRRIGEPWCCLGIYGMSAPITPVCRRIGAIRVKGGKYTLDPKYAVGPIDCPEAPKV